ncbi:hypothetical protein H2O64_21470 [Kordia sp. YSTF-M3]|uniref:Uncharacterized protein n=1 Tax=Kordia aestuariivivens TaxID=2759037 RepID=A0ABR7QFD4_9FLAO|nr:hypothetical protein [Kordia aestuariivivens]MBC8757254.1 hypothetical protein [Kordia aestuariivivens]
MERIAFDLVVFKKGIFFDVFNSKIIPSIGLIGLISLFSFVAIYYMLYGVHLFDYFVFNFIGFLFFVMAFIQIMKIFGDADGTYLKKEGLLLIDENEITIDYTTKYPITEITYVKFKMMNFIKPRMFVYTDRRIRRYTATDNYLEFQYKNKKYNFQFIVDSEGHKQVLIEKLIPQLRTKTEASYMIY